jgi:hypothetical protein
MDNDKVVMYHITKTEYQGGCCHDCDPNMGKPYSQKYYVSDEEYAKLMSDHWEREEITHVRKLTDSENDAYQAGVDAQRIKAHNEKYAQQDLSKKHLKTIVDALGWAVREAGVKIPYEISYNFAIGIPEDELYKSFGWTDDYELMKLFRNGSGESYAPKEPSNELADWEIALLKATEDKDKEQGDTNE